MQENLQIYYMITVELKFFFFLDQANLKKVKIADVIASGFLDEAISMVIDDGISW